MKLALPRQPFVGLAIAAITGILVADLWPYHSVALFATFLLLGLIALATARSVAVHAFVAFSFFLLHSLRVLDPPVTKLTRELGDEPRPVTVCGTVASEPKTSPSGTTSFLLQAQSIEIDGTTQRCNVKFLTRWRHQVEFGDQINLFGTAEVPNGPRNPGEFDMRSYLARQDIQRLLIGRSPENGVILTHATGNWMRRAALKSRDWMQAVLARGIEDSADVVGAIHGMVLGLRHQTAEDIEEPFQQTGTLHLFAVAGLHVGIVARLLWSLAVIVRLPRAWATALMIPALLFYSAVTGLHISSVRAAVMSAALLAGFFAERKMLPINNLAAAATLILCWNSNELFSVGFQLSFSVVATIVLLADPTYRYLRGLFAPDPFLPRNLLDVRRQLTAHTTSWLARAASVSFAAWIGSLPLMLGYYHLVTPISLLANLVVVPIAFFVLAGGLLSMLAAPFSGSLSILFNNSNWLLTKIILGSVHLFALIPGGHLYVEHPHWPVKTDLEINVLDLNAGGSIHLHAGGNDWLFDAGSQRDYDRVVRPYLRSRGIERLDGIALTHGDAAHLGGAATALLDFRPRQLVDTATRDRSLVHRRLIADLAQKKHPRRLCVAGDEFSLTSDSTAKILFPPAGFQGNRADDQALVIQLVVAGKSRALLMSDNGIATEEFLLKHYPNLRSEILVKGQHHTGSSGSDKFLNAVQPQVIVATSRDFPKNERLSDDWAEGLTARGIKLFRQDQTGAVQLRIFRDRFEARAYVTGETFCSTRL